MGSTDVNVRIESLSFETQMSSAKHLRTSQVDIFVSRDAPIVKVDDLPI